MASGDTKTEALLNILGHGGSVDGITGSGNTKTQDYLVDAIGRLQGIEDDVEELKNNPDVVDIVDTYADLQAYDTQHLTDNDVIRVLADETHNGNSAYYRFTKNPDTWTFIGEISSGPTVVQTTGTSQTDVMSQDATTKMVYKNGNTGQVCIGEDAEVNTTYGSTAIGRGAKATGQTATALGPVNATASGKHSIAIGNSAQATQTGAICIGYASLANQSNAICIGYGTYARGDNSVSIGASANIASTAGGKCIAIGSEAKVELVSTHGVAIGNEADVQAAYSVALGDHAKATRIGEVNVGTGTTPWGYNNTAYRVIGGVYDGQDAHDAATVGQAVGTTESYTIATSDWTALSASSPYTYQATVTATYTIGNSTIAELLNDAPVTFATYGFAIGAISGQTVTIYSIGQPSASVTLKVNYKG